MATAWVPILLVLKYPCCHQLITQTHPGATEGFQKKSKFEKKKKIQLTPNSLTGIETAKSSLARATGRDDRGYPQPINEHWSCCVHHQ